MISFITLHIRASDKFYLRLCTSISLVSECLSSGFCMRLGNYFGVMLLRSIFTFSAPLMLRVEFCLNTRAFGLP